MCVHVCVHMPITTVQIHPFHMQSAFGTIPAESKMHVVASMHVVEMIEGKLRSTCAHMPYERRTACIAANDYL